jgi:hypothetical protein
VPVRSLLEALLAPAVHALRGPDASGRGIAGRIYSEPEDVVRPLIQELFGELSARYLAALARALPGLPKGELHWRFQLVIGLMTHVLSGKHELSPLSGGLPDLEDADAIVRRMVDFAEAGMCAGTPGQGS